MNSAENGAVAGGDSQATIAQKTWEMSNNMEGVSGVDEIYKYDRKQQQDILTAKPWDKEYVHLSNIKMPSLHY